jgi:hypothetical protein
MRALFGASTSAVDVIETTTRGREAKMGWRGKNLVAGVVLVGAVGVVAHAEDRVPLNARLAAAKPATARGGVARTEPDLAVRVTPRFAVAPGGVRSSIRVNPHEANRVLRVEIDSGDFYRASQIELAGDHAALTHFFTWTSLPAGTYALTVTVFGNDGPRVQKQMAFDVIGRGAEAPR